jgi:pimeloyl-ACP methyl ester carboxylesterase
VNGFLEVSGGALELLDLPGSGAPTLVLLHEGLGSVGLWRGFPADLNRLTRLRTVAFSRFGHGRSALPRSPRTPVSMHEDAFIVLPEVLMRLEIERPVLVGHSEGASIALIHASEHPVSGLVILAPHVFVEDMCIAAIEEVSAGFEANLLERMARHHDDPTVTFGGWAGVWLDPAFRDWDISDLLPRVTAPTLVIQGADDQYGTLAQVDAVVDGISGDSEVMVVPGGHSPHLEQRDKVVGAAVRFIGSVARSDGAAR